MNPNELVEPREHPRRPNGSGTGASHGAPGYSATGLWRSFMTLIPSKTRKQLRKNVRKIVRAHGPEFAAAIATGIATSLLSMSSAPGKKKKKKNKKKH